MMDKNYWITETPIEPNDCIKKVARNEAGAVNTFIGTVREFTKDKRTLYLEYQAYVPMAEKKLAQIGEEIEQKWGDANTAIVHRIGRLEIADIAVVIAVSTPHRADAFEASRYAIERIKEIVPIWKKEHWEDGTKWIGDQKENKSYDKKIPSEEEMRDD
ncbi:molybdenum cofactor biosynthesis protein MoaE [Lentibacillus cibarius]|uniref:Molybdopterin synthase catalytic subunit n=1 Tax=Lentibacillus cibarius TaxID=2583219 RepID=A0A549YJ46_9BACI|nr:molybdenum cofactor biosynthesis protein MoaE [Lentibacillus cibarius]TMN23093.1 molybdenum cofactor biosynthesis protein MoaE [Lentibacillus cibarius]TRM11898.1 molybdenum cofactor biosynthesis protein MoaE [Lentibacillus cibarius]